MSVVYHKLSEGNLTQDWSTSSLISSSDNWSGVESIQGFSTVTFGSGVGTDPRAFVFDSQSEDVAANQFTAPSQLNPDVGGNGGLAEFQDFGIVALGAGDGAKVPNLVLYLDTTDMTAPVTLQFDVQDLDSTSHDAQQQLNVQYRIGETGVWTNLAGGYLADVTQVDATPTTHVNLTLPPEVLGQAQLQVRIMTADAQGQDEWIGIDNIVVACFLRGTLIRTPQGEVPVESLSMDDEVVTLGGQVEPIKWVGRRAYSTRFLAMNSPVAPVLIRAGALSEDAPSQDLRVSPEHALLIDGVLIPAIDLVNGRTIVRELEGDAVEYFHIELANHAIVYANGAEAETYVNHDNRKMFANWPEYLMLFGHDETRRAADGTFERGYPCVRSGPQFDAICARIDRRLRELADAA